ncbi:hypothetical protein GTU79_09425 [Sodalis ligni]|uniref:hypothetical protein n=1 Tax=Sodalis ligni TaxID=2697027 RepID=UPI001BDE699C|nr:hypothetical protein [Sodalis ligni]QWA12871.1 hypothetical protein GTU79_09425 [Sodalis ligni]
MKDIYGNLFSNEIFSFALGTDIRLWLFLPAGWTTPAKRHSVLIRPAINGQGGCRRFNIGKDRVLTLPPAPGVTSRTDNV